MALIVPVKDIREAMALTDEIVGLNTAVERAIEMAQQAVSESFRSPFERVTVVDEFWVHHSRKFGDSHQTALLLSRGLVDEGESISIFASGIRNYLDDSSQRVNLQDVSGDNLIRLDSDIGVIDITEYDLSFCFVRVSYTAGLLDNNSSPPIYQDVPTWLSQAVRLNTQVLLDANPIIPRPTVRDEKGTAQTDIAEKQLASIMLSKSRYHPRAVKPKYTSETPV